MHTIKNFPIGILQTENPTYEEMADMLKVVASILTTISEQYPNDPESYHKACKAESYAHHVKQVSLAIQNNKEELKKLTEKLNKESFL